MMCWCHYFSGPPGRARCPGCGTSQPTLWGEAKCGEASAGGVADMVTRYSNPGAGGPRRCRHACAARTCTPLRDFAQRKWSHLRSTRHCCLSWVPTVCGPLLYCPTLRASQSATQPLCNARSCAVLCLRDCCAFGESPFPWEPRVAGVWALAAGGLASFCYWFLSHHEVLVLLGRALPLAPSGSGRCLPLAT